MHSVCGAHCRSLINESAIATYSNMLLVILAASSILTSALEWVSPDSALPNRLRYKLHSTYAHGLHLSAIQVAAFALKSLLAGDTSKWSEAIRREHYNPAGMPVVTWKIVLHLLQQINSHKFTRFDYGSEKNREIYHSDMPLDVSTLYNLIDFRIDFVAGAKDSIVSPKAVQRHVNAVVKANEKRVATGKPPISWTYEVLPHLGHLDIIDGEDNVTVDCLRKCWQRMYK